MTPLGAGNKYLALSLGLAVFMGLGAPGDAQADERGHRGHGKPEWRGRAAPPGHYRDTRHRHGRLYPAPGHAVAVLPPRHHLVIHRAAPFHHWAGVWYRPVGPRFVTVIPPIGLVVPSLPPHCAIVRVRGVRYYYANSVYYTPGSGGYVVAPPPPAEVILEQPSSGGGEYPIIEEPVNPDAGLGYPPPR